MKKHFLTASSLILGLMFIALPVYAEFTPSSWKYVRQIVTPEVDTASYVRVPLDKDVAFASNNFRDIRIVTEDREVPYQKVISAGLSSQQAYRSTVLDLSSTGTQTMFIVDLGKTGVVHDEIEILTSSPNYKKQVAIYAADELLGHSDSSWRKLTDSGYIFSFTDTQANFNAKGGRVSYPKSTSRFIRVVLSGGGGGAVTVTGARVINDQSVPVQEEIQTFPLTIIQNTEQKTTEAVVDTGGTGYPTHAIALTSTSKNFNRRVVVHGSNDKTNWSLLSQDYIFALDTKLFKGSHLTIQYPETTSRYIRVVIFNEDNQPVALSQTASVKSYSRSLIFEVQPGEQYELYTGNTDAYEPRYDLARFFQYVETTSIPTASLGILQENTAYVPPATVVPPVTERYPWLLNVTLSVLVVIIAGLAFLYIRKISRANSTMPPTPGQGM